MIYIIIVAIGVLGALLLGGKALGGPSPRKSLKRRVELIKERHAEGGALAANAQAQIRKLMAARQSRVEGFASTLIPKPALMRKRLDQTGYGRLERRDASPQVQTQIERHLLVT